MPFTLVVGDKNLSSWSLRPWLLLEQAGIPFEEILVRLHRPDSAEHIRRYSPAGRVPVLRDADVTVWDSLAICEYLAERFPDKQLWPADRVARANARSICAEMHSGFGKLREHMSMNITASLPGQGRAEGVQADIDRVCAIWRDCRRRFGAGGPFLFARFTIADAFFAPVTTRFRTYAVELDDTCSAYCRAIWALPAMQEWVEGAEAETAA